MKAAIGTRWALGLLLGTILGSGAAGTSAALADAEAGRLKAGLCANCHGPAGISHIEKVPSLAGQHPEYLRAQFVHYLLGARQDLVMTEVARSVKNQDVEDLAAYYAGLPPMSAGGVPVDLSLVPRGQSLYTPCAGCHGPNGAGGGAVPRLAGQRPDYTFIQLQHYQTGARKHTVMEAVVRGLTEEDLRALAAYLASLN
jgi:cytochrome c553